MQTNPANPSIYNYNDDDDDDDVYVLTGQHRRHYNTSQQHQHRQPSVSVSVSIVMLPARRHQSNVNVETLYHAVLNLTLRCFIDQSTPAAHSLPLSLQLQTLSAPSNLQLARSYMSK